MKKAEQINAQNVKEKNIKPIKINRQLSRQKKLITNIIIAYR